MKYDIAIQTDNRILLVVEVDGRQHFESNKKFEQTQLNDVEKEVAAIDAGVPVLRLFQPDVWNDRFDWKAWLRSQVSLALTKQLIVGVHRQPGCTMYSSDRYVERRVATSVAVV